MCYSEPLRIGSLNDKQLALLNLFHLYFRKKMVLDLVLVLALAAQQPRIALRPAAAPSWPGASMLVSDAPAKQWFNEGALTFSTKSPSHIQSIGCTAARAHFFYCSGVALPIKQHVFWTHRCVGGHARSGADGAGTGVLLTASAHFCLYGCCTS